MDSKELNVKAPVKRVAGPMAGQLLPNQQAKSFCSKSKDKLMNAKCACTAYRNRNCSKVPRIVRVSSKTNVNKNTFRVERKLDDSGDNKAGPSKLTSISKKNIMPEKLKPSQIPRRKPTSNENSNKESPTKKRYQRLGDSTNSRNVQRIQLFINQDFHPEERVPASSIAATRPIPTLPTLGQIYARENGIDANILNDWFVELDTPVNSMASNFFNISSRLLDVRATAENDKATANKRATTVSNLEFDNPNYAPNTFRTTDENTSDWLSSDIEYPTRDNESGYHSISPPTYTPIDIKSKHSKCSLASTKVENIPEIDLSESSSKRSIQISLPNKSTAATIKDQSTIVMAQKTPASITTAGGESKKVAKADHSKNYQYPSRNHTASHRVQVSQPQVTVPSYVECPSEILQKTTNFEDAVPASDTTNTVSSVAGTDSEFHDDLSSQCIMEHDDSIDDRSPLEWCHQCRSCARDEKSMDSEDTSVADSLICQYNDDILHSSLMNSSEDYPHQFHWKNHYNGTSHCKKCHRYRRFPSTRYRLPKTLASLRKRMSLRLCRRRLNKVWKKTTERWAVWSAKSPHKFKKLGMMHYLQRSLLWEDVDVQTNAFVYRETGTGPTLKEQKSAAVSAMFKFQPSSTSNKNRSDTTAVPCNNPSKFRQINIGPSMYPLLFNTQNKPVSQELKQDKVILIGKENIVDNPKPIATMNLKPVENKHVENHVITQTISCCQSKDKNEVNRTDRQIDTANESENYIEICEVCMDDKNTGTEEMLYLMKDGVTSTVMDLSAFKENDWETQNAHTQMQIVCNNAETDVQFIPTQDIRSTSVFTRVSDNANFYKPYGTNTDLNLQSMNILTSELIKHSPTSNHVDTQVTPVQSLKKISTGILTTKSLFENKTEKVSTSTGMDDFIENNLKDFTNQVMPQLSSFMSSETPKAAQVKSGDCLTSLSLCRRFPQVETSSCGTETNYSKYDTTSTNKLKIYLNTGMLINTLVEGAIKHNGANLSTSTDPKSIGKYTSEIATCTNSESKGSVIEKEKDGNFTGISVDTHSYTKQQAKPMSRRPEWKKANDVGQTKTDSCTQYSYIAPNDMVSNCLERIGRSRLLSVRTLSHAAEETGAQTEPVRIDGVMYAPRQYKAVFTSQCALDQPLKPAATLMKDSVLKAATTLKKDSVLKPATILMKDLGQTNCLSSSPTSSRRKSSSNRTSSFRINPSATLSSDLSTNMWIKSYIEKGYQCQLEIGRKLNDDKPASMYSSCDSPEEKKSDSKSVDSETQSECQHVTNNVASPRRDMAIEKCNKDRTKDSIADIDKQIVKMVDNVTSDEIVKKDVKENILQANPENSGAATKIALEQKSACVFTSRCILPAQSLYNCQLKNCGSLPGDCLFVYGKPRCVVHLNNERESSDAAVQISFSQNHEEYCPLANQMPSVCEALYKTTQLISQQELKLQELKNLCKSYGVDAEVETCLLEAEMRSDSMMTSPNVRSATVVTSQCNRSFVSKTDQFTQQDPMFCFPSWNDYSFLQSREDGGVQTSWDDQQVLLEVPTHDEDSAQNQSKGRFSKNYRTSNLALNGTRKDIAKVNSHEHAKDPEESVKTHLVASCRYYSALLTKQLARAREQLAKHLTPLETNYSYQVPNAYTEACTMKPSAREEFGCQTFKNRTYYKGSRFTTNLSPAVSLIDIRHHDKEHLKAVYFMLSAIEGRLRRFKYNIE